MIRQLFIDHPRSVGESYLEHQAVALSFAGPLFVAAFGALVHAFVPGLCRTTGSRTILQLHGRISGSHGRGAARDAEYMI